MCLQDFVFLCSISIIVFMAYMLRGGANNTTVPYMPFSSNYSLFPCVSDTRSVYNKHVLKVSCFFCFSHIFLYLLIYLLKACFASSELSYNTLDFTCN